MDHISWHDASLRWEHSFAYFERCILHCFSGRDGISPVPYLVLIKHFEAYWPFHNSVSWAIVSAQKLYRLDSGCYKDPRISQQVLMQQHTQTLYFSCTDMSHLTLTMFHGQTSNTVIHWALATAHHRGVMQAYNLGIWAARYNIWQHCAKGTVFSFLCMFCGDVEDLQYDDCNCGLGLDILLFIIFPLLWHKHVC